VVNYQGPEAIRGLVEAMHVPIFNRVTQIRYEFKDVREIPLNKEDVARLSQLEQISVTKRSKTNVTASEIDVVREFVPTCRVASLQQAQNEISLELTHSLVFRGGCSE
jgi:hypothetical protein